MFLAIGIENPDGKFDANAGSLPTDETEKAAFLKMTKDFFEAAFEEKFGCEFQLLEVSECE